MIRSLDVCFPYIDNNFYTIAGNNIFNLFVILLLLKIQSDDSE